MLQNTESIKKIHLKDEQKQLIFQDIEEGVLSMMEISKKHKVKYKTIISMRKERQDQAKDIKQYLIDSTYDVLTKRQGPIKKFHVKREIRKFIINPSYYFQTLIINYNSIMKKRPFDENNRKIIDKIYLEVIKRLKENQFDVQINLKNQKRNFQTFQKNKKQSNCILKIEDEEQFESQNNSSDAPFISQSPFFSDFLIQNNKFFQESENFQQQDSEL